MESDKKNRQDVKKKLLKHLNDKEFLTLKDYLLPRFDIGSIVVEILLRTGLRQQEVVQLKRINLDTNRRYVFATTLKRNSPRKIPVHPDFLPKMYHLCLLLGENKTIGDLVSDSMKQTHQTRNVQRHFHKIMTEVFGENHDWTTHALRHTFALRCLMVTRKDIQKVQLAMGHKQLKTTLVYLQYLESEDLEPEILRAIG